MARLIFQNFVEMLLLRLILVVSHQTVPQQIQVKSKIQINFEMKFFNYSLLLNDIFMQIVQKSVMKRRLLIPILLEFS